MAAELNLTIDQGGRFLKEIIWKTGAPAVPVDLTGYTAKAQIRQTHSSELLADLSAHITLGGPNGKIRIEIPGSITAGFAWPASAVWDLHLISSGKPTRLLQGRVELSPGVTRD